MHFSFTASTSKKEVSKEVADFIEEKELSVENQDFDRPWGGFFKISESQIDQFIKLFFADKQIDQPTGGKLSPKILVVAPHLRLSWQYHHRRSEVWKVIFGPVGVVISDNDNESGEKIYQTGDIITIGKEKRHRLTGQDNWGVVAEIWSHEDSTKLSDEDDIVRVQDDFGR